MISVVAGVGAALTLVLGACMAGVFYAFSVSVMPGLDAIRSAEAGRAMQSINIKILNPVFMVTLVGYPLAAVLTGVLLMVDGHTGPGAWFLVAAGTYVFGSILPTGVVNVPLNNQLLAAHIPDNPDNPDNPDDPDDPAGTEQADRIWAAYSPRWTRWNHLRAVLNAVSVLFVGLALYLWGTQS